ncbi:MAG: GntR family transcriptional regulator, partial [Verrucomicrobiota bacterium]
MKSQYPQAAQALQQWIARRGIRPGNALPSARMLANEIGFTPFIIHRACQQLIADGVLQRKGYKLFAGSGNPARAPIAGEVQVLSYLQPFARTAGRLLTGLGVRHRVVELSFSRELNPLLPLRKALAEKPAGIMLWIPCWTHKLQMGLETKNIPLVICTEFSTPEVKYSMVGTDVYRGVFKALKH